MVPATGSRSVAHKPLLIDAGIVEGGVQQQVAVFGQGKGRTGLQDLFCRFIKWGEGEDRNSIITLIVREFGNKHYLSVCP